MAEQKTNDSDVKNFTPPAKTFTVEFFVGLFALVGCAAFGYLSINIAGMSLFDTNYYHVTAEFDNISGLQDGASVELAGVPIGEVESISLTDTSAKVHMKVLKSVPIRDDDSAAIRTKGIIGDRYVKIIPGGSEKIVQPGGEIFQTESVVEFEEVIGKFIHSLDSGEES